MHVIKGMVQVGGNTYRIVRLEPGHYAIIQILDDERVGTFRPSPHLQITSGDKDLVLRVARAAVQRGKTSWAGRLNVG